MMAIVLQLYRLLLYGLPRELRLEFGHDMARAFADACARAASERGFTGVARVTLYACSDLVTRVPREWLDRFDAAPWRRASLRQVHLKEGRRVRMLDTLRQDVQYAISPVVDANPKRRWRRSERAGRRRTASNSPPGSHSHRPAQRPADPDQGRAPRHRNFRSPRRER